MTRTRWVCAVLALAALPSFVGIVSPHDLEVHDQARQALYVSSALDGSWLLPRERGVIATKPPLYTWLAAVGSIVLGENEYAVRLPSVLASFGLGLLVFDLGRRLHGREVGLVALALFATLPYVVKLSFLARTDMLLAFWIALAMWAALRRSALLFWTCVGLGALTKGPVGLVVPPLAVAIEALARSDAERWRALRPLRGALLVLAIVAAWLVPALAIGGDDLLHMADVELLDRLTGGGRWATTDHQPFWYLLPQVFVTLAPCSLLLPLALARPEATARATRPFLASWILTVLLVVSLPAEKRADYLLPLFAPALLLVSALLVAWRRGALPDGTTRWIDVGTRFWAVGAGLAAAGGAIGILTGAISPPAEPPAWVLALGLAGLLPLAWTAWVRAGRAERLAGALAAQALLVLVWANVWALPAAAGDAPALRQFARQVAQATHAEPIEFHRARSRSIQFLLRRNAAELDAAQLVARASAPGGTWVVLSGSRYAELAADSGLFCRLASPRPILQSAPRRKQQGDPLVLAHVDASRREEPCPARRP